MRMATHLFQELITKTVMTSRAFMLILINCVIISMSSLVEIMVMREEMMDQVGNQVLDQVESQVCIQVESQVWDHAWQQILEDFDDA